MQWNHKVILAEVTIRCLRCPNTIISTRLLDRIVAPPKQSATTMSSHIPPTMQGPPFRHTRARPVLPHRQFHYTNNNQRLPPKTIDDWAVRKVATPAVNENDTRFENIEDIYILPVMFARANLYRICSQGIASFYQ